HVRRSVGLPRVAAQPRRRLVDAPDVGPNGLTVPAPGHHEVASVELGAPHVVDRQVDTVRLARPLSPDQTRQARLQLAALPNTWPSRVVSLFKHNQKCQYTKRTWPLSCRSTRFTSW